MIRGWQLDVFIGGDVWKRVNLTHFPFEMF